MKSRLGEETNLKTIHYEAEERKSSREGQAKALKVCTGRDDFLPTEGLDHPTERGLSCF